MYVLYTPFGMLDNGLNVILHEFTHDLCLKCMGRKYRKNCQVLDEQVGFEVRWAIAGTSIVTQVSVSWPEEDGDDRNNDAERANIITR